jgi:hypothetical protein
LASLAVGFGVLMVLLLLAFAPLVALGHDSQNSWVTNAPWIAIAFVFSAVGVVLARRQPKNSIGWILIYAGLAFMLITDSSAYLILDYRAAHGQLPLGPVVLWLNPLGITSFLAIGLPILLFPDGHAPSRRWRRTLWAYIGIGLGATVCNVGSTVAATIGHRIRINAAGNLTILQHPTGVAAGLTIVGSLALVLLLPILVPWVLRLALSFRHSTGERRQQLKWLLGGAGFTVVSVGVFIAGSALSSAGNSGGNSGSTSLVADLLYGLLVLVIAAFPIGMGVGILKYRLYDIDRLISRTLSYATVTGLLVGVYVGLVTLATRVLPFSSPIGVAASTLVAVALFNPLRRRVQRLVDRRFNRAGYDAEAMVSAFARRVRDDVDLEVVSSEFVRAVQTSVEPSQVSLWLRPTGPSS